MNRRAFITALPLIPVAAKAVVANAPELPNLEDRANTLGIHTMLQECRSVVDAEPLDLDKIFELLYEVKKRREGCA